MTNRQIIGAAVLAFLLLHFGSPPADSPEPDSKPAPLIPRPKPKPRPWDAGAAPVGAPAEGGKTSPDGKVEIACDLPASEKKENVGGRDGAGLCVFTSIEYSARWQNERRLFDFQKFMRSKPGGGYPEKVDRMIAEFAPGVRYVQHTGGDYEVLKQAIKSGRMPAVTYDGRDPHYRGSIAHMVSLAHADDDWACITDNNYPGDNEFVWMSKSDFMSRWRGNGGGWAVFLLNPPPPPVPFN